MNHKIYGGCNCCHDNEVVCSEMFLHMHGKQTTLNKVQTKGQYWQGDVCGVVYYQKKMFTAEMCSCDRGSHQLEYWHGQ